MFFNVLNFKWNNKDTILASYILITVPSKPKKTQKETAY